MDEFLKPVLEHGSGGFVAAIVIYLVRYFNELQRAAMKEEREAHDREIDKLTATFSAIMHDLTNALDRKE